MRVPEQVPGALLLTRGSLDGATDSNIHAPNILNPRKNNLSPGQSCQCPPSKSALLAPYIVPWSNLSQGSRL